MVKYFEVMYVLDENLNLQAARTKVVYGDLTASATSFPRLLYTAAYFNFVAESDLVRPHLEHRGDSRILAGRPRTGRNSSTWNERLRAAL